MLLQLGMLMWVRLKKRIYFLFLAIVLQKLRFTKMLLLKNFYIKNMGLILIG
ncbi:Uncharacterised protein [Klebsiella pneumoniae]|uniref:Uncharacterized protein n=1 Tax=Klebsiella pneumoniae TaxID=573 RepID=A0A378FTN7_KLEPN|nr:Uncharacterised protein [Klebsiella pneumoniae]